MTGQMDFTDDMDMSVEAMRSVQVRRTGKIRRGGEKRFTIKRFTSKGVVPVRGGLTFDQAMKIANNGSGDFLEMEE